MGIVSTVLISSRHFRRHIVQSGHTTASLARHYSTPGHRRARDNLVPGLPHDVKMWSALSPLPSLNEENRNLPKIFGPGLRIRAVCKDYDKKAI